MIELRTRNRIGHVEGVGDIRNTYRFLVRKLERKRLAARYRHRKKLKCFLKKQDEILWTGLIWLRIRKSKGHMSTRERGFGFHSGRNFIH